MAKKTNKKRLGIAAMGLGLVVAVGATAGTTLAKYISSATIPTETATVAQWGFTVSANVSNLFGHSYGGGIIKSTSGPKGVGDDTIDVIASTDDALLVAPGTSGSATFTFNGTAEVNAEFEFVVDKAVTSVVLTDGEGYNYYPLVWTVGNTVLNANHDTKVTADTIAEAIAKEWNVEYTTGNTVTVKIPANMSISAYTLTIGWEWEFEVDDATNIKDTLLGYISAGKDYSALSENVVSALKAQVADSLTSEKATYDAAKEDYATAAGKWEEAQKQYRAAKKAYDYANVAFKTAEANKTAAEQEKTDAENAKTTAAAAYGDEESGAVKAWDDAKAEYEAAKTAYAEGGTFEEWQAAQKKYEKAEADFNAVEAEYTAAVARFNAADAALTEATNKYNTADATWQAAQKAWNGTEGEEEGAVSKYNTAKDAWEKAVKDWTDAETEYNDAVAAKAEAFYKKLVINSKIQVTFGLRTTIQQTQNK